MPTNKKIVLVLLILFAALSCKNDNVNSAIRNEKNFTFDEIKKASWLIGTWQNTSNDGTLTEKWNKLNDSVLIGNTNLIAGNDTLFSENIRLFERNKKLYYTPIVSDQNDGKAVSFVLTKTSKNELIFENPRHDFPQKISYKRIGSASLIAVVSGTKNGKVAMETFPMKKQINQR